MRQRSAAALCLAIARRGPPGLRQATTAAKISYLRAGKSRNRNPQSWTPFHESNSLTQQQP